MMLLGLAGERDAFGQRGQPAAEHHHVGRGLRDVGAFAHRDRHLRAGQHRRVVDAVAHHGDDAALLLQRLHIGELVFRQRAGVPLGDAELLRRRPDRSFGIARHQVQAQALPLQGGERGGGIGARRVGECEPGDQLVFCGERDPAFVPFRVLAAAGGGRLRRCLAAAAKRGEPRR